MNNPFEVIESRLSNIESLLLDIKHSPIKVKANSETWLDLKELCNYHPDKPSKATVYGWVSAKTIPVHKTGKKLRFLKSEIDNWLLQGKKMTYADTTSEAVLFLSQRNRG